MCSSEMNGMLKANVLLFGKRDTTGRESAGESHSQLTGSLNDPQVALLFDLS